MYPNNSASNLQVLNICTQTESWVVRRSAACLREPRIATGYLQKYSSFGSSLRMKGKQRSMRTKEAKNKYRKD